MEDIFKCSGYKENCSLEEKTTYAKHQALKMWGKHFESADLSLKTKEISSEGGGADYKNIRLGFSRAELLFSSDISRMLVKSMIMVDGKKMLHKHAFFSFVKSETNKHQYSDPSLDAEREYILAPKDIQFLKDANSGECFVVTRVGLKNGYLTKDADYADLSVKVSVPDYLSWEEVVQDGFLVKGLSLAQQQEVASFLKTRPEKNKLFPRGIKKLTEAHGFDLEGLGA